MVRCIATRPTVRLCLLQIAAATGISQAMLSSLAIASGVLDGLGYKMDTHRYSSGWTLRPDMRAGRLAGTHAGTRAVPSTAGL